MMKFRAITSTLAAIPALFLLAACAPEQGTQGAPAMPTVSVAPVIQETITELNEYSGRLAAPEAVELRPRVSGHIDKVMFRDGQLVEQGTPLLLIDSKPFEARVQQLEADLEHARSRASLAQAELRRAEKLIRKNAIAQEVLDSRQAEYQQAAAQVKSVESALKLANLDLAYTTVKAPITGQVSNAFETRGNYVTAGQSVLTEIVSTDRLYAYFEADERSYLDYRKAEKKGLVPSNRSGEAPVFMSLAGEKEYAHEGTIDFVDNKVNESTGTIRMRAVFDNADNLLVPGLFSRLRVVGSASYEAILIQDAAIGTDLDKQYVLVLDENNAVQYRAIETGKKVGGLRVVKSGLEASEKIVVNGLQRVRPGTPVEPRDVVMADPENIEQLQALQMRIDSLDKRQQVAATPDSDVKVAAQTL